MAPKHPPGPAMTLGNMRDLGVQNLIASCLNEACRHTALVDVSSYPAETKIPYFKSRVVFVQSRPAFGLCGVASGIRVLR